MQKTISACRMRSAVRRRLAPSCSIPSSARAFTASIEGGTPSGANTPAEAATSPDFSPGPPCAIQCRAIASAMGLRQVFPVHT